MKTHRRKMRTRFSAWPLLFALSLLLFLPACGSGNGQSSSPSSWRYTALGDSLAVGVLASEGYVPRYLDYAKTDANPSISLTNLGQNGWESSDLLNAITNDPNFRNAVSSAQVVTLDIGGNDLLHNVRLFGEGTCGGADNQDCLRTAVANFATNWDAIVQQILALRDPRQTIIRTMDVYNPFVVEQMVSGTFLILKPYLDQVDAHIAASSSAHGIPMAAVYRTFNGPNGDEDPIAKGFISIDGFHPNDNGHKAIADLFRALGYAPLK